MECKYRYLIYLSAVHDKANAVYGDRRLGDVGRHDALAHAIGRVVENLVLVLERKCAVQGQHNPLGVSADMYAELSHVSGVARFPKFSHSPLRVLLARICHRRDLSKTARRKYTGGNLEGTLKSNRARKKGKTS